VTTGQSRAIRELNEIQSADPDGFEIIAPPEITNGTLMAGISLRLGLIETREGGLELMEREEFWIIIPPDFPFDYPSLCVLHDRFAAFPHVIWTHAICLYQSKIEWNPADGLYGFFDRLRLWLGRAAINDMDAVEGPLEPPHHGTDFSQVPFVVRCNAPVQAGETWFGLAELEKTPNRIELLAWNDLLSGPPKCPLLAVAIILAKSLPMEFPRKGADFFKELLKQGVDRERILKHLALAALFSSDGEPVHLVIGVPMRRAADGSVKLHFAVWTTDADFANLLRHTLSKEDDPEKMTALRKEISDWLYSAFESHNIKWCQVLEDRSEIIVRRDHGTPIAWFAGKRILVLGCGALGSWAAEILARTNPKAIHLDDNAIVKPGVLARQNFQLADIGANKAVALTQRLESIAFGVSVVGFNLEAYRFLTEKPEDINNYDVVLDCTASAIFQMKLERDWNRFPTDKPPFISFITDARAQQALCVVLGQNARTGVWDAYVRLKQKLCYEENRREIVTAFYSKRSTEPMFQPEPGCSDPTFVGSTADVSTLVSTVLNLAVGRNIGAGTATGITVTSPKTDGKSGAVAIIHLPAFEETTVADYRIRISRTVFNEARGWVKQNNRIRSPSHETGGLLWGQWDDAIGVIWIFDASGPPHDSKHDPGHFLCGVRGTINEHNHRIKSSHGTCGFIGFWHTHPDMPSEQSPTDIHGMANLVSSFGQNQRRSLMLIFGRTSGTPTAGAYVYESRHLGQSSNLVSVGLAQFVLRTSVV
jgi:molybdopterin/thiamine biosynthesis adenylyltransferase